MIIAIRRSSSLKALGILIVVRNIKYLCKLVRGEELHQLDTLFSEVGITTSEHLRYNLLVLGTYFPPVNVLSKQRRAMCRGTRNPLGLKVRKYTAHMIKINEYLDVLHGEKAIDKICEMEFNETIVEQNS